MSIVTNLLGRLGIFGAIQPKIGKLVAKLAVESTKIQWPSLSPEWSSTALAEGFRRQNVASRAISEMQVRSPIAR